MRPIDRFVAVVGLSNFGTGLVFPYTAIFLTTRTDLGVGGAALFFAVVSATNFAGGMALSVYRRTSRPGLVSGLGSTVAAVAYTSVAFAHTVPTIVITAVGVGIGRALSTAGNAPLIRAMVPAEQQREAFGRWYRAMNAGLGLGTLAGSALTAWMSESVLGPLFVVNGISFLPLAWFLVGQRDLGRAPAKSDRQHGMSFRELMRATVGVTVVQFAVYLLAYSQFEATTPLVANKLMGLDLGLVSLVVTVNTVAVIITQKPVTRLLTAHSPRAGVLVAVAAWVVGFAIAAATSPLPGPFRVAGLLLFGVVFALGEAAYSCSYSPWLLASVPESEATRTSSLSNAMRGVGSSAGPALGVLLMGTGSATVLWAAMAVGCAGLGALAGTVRTRSLESR